MVREQRKSLGVTFVTWKYLKILKLQTGSRSMDELLRLLIKSYLEREVGLRVDRRA